MDDNKYTPQRLLQWQWFSDRVADHIEHYTVPQYGDWPSDQLTSFSREVIISNMQRYMNRINTNARGKEESLRDLLKLVHYAAVLYANESHLWHFRGE